MLGINKADEDAGSTMGIELLLNPQKVKMNTGDSPRSAMDNNDFHVTFGGKSDGDGASVNSFASSSKSGKSRSSRSSSKSAIKIRVATSESDATSESGWGMPAMKHAPHVVAPRPQEHSAEEVLNMKREILYQLNRLEKKGIQIPKRFSLSSSLDEMKAEFERLKRDMEVDASVRFQRRMLMACVSGLEFLNHKFDPFSVYLDGWSESVQEGINDYDDVFEELWDKYHTKVKMAPELRLMFMLGGSAVWFHISHSMFKSIPGVEQVFKQNPELKRQFMDATFKTMQSQGGEAQAQTLPMGGGDGGGGGGGLFGGLGNLMGGLFGGGGGGGSAMPPQRPFEGERPNMRGPTNVDDLLNELQADTFARNDLGEDLEIFSTISGVSDGTGVTDDAMGALLMDKPKGKKKARRTLEI